MQLTIKPEKDMLVREKKWFNILAMLSVGEVEKGMQFTNMEDRDRVVIEC